MKTKHIIISGPQKDWNSQIARQLLQLVHYKYTTALHHEMTEIQMSRFKVLPYMKLLLVDGCKDAIAIAEQTKRIGLFTDAAIIFTCQKPCRALAMEDRFNVIELG